MVALDDENDGDELLKRGMFELRDAATCGLDMTARPHERTILHLVTMRTTLNSASTRLVPIANSTPWWLSYKAIALSANY